MHVEVIENNKHSNDSCNYASLQSPSALLAEAVTQVICFKIEESSLRFSNHFHCNYYRNTAGHWI